MSSQVRNTTLTQSSEAANQSKQAQYNTRFSRGLVLLGAAAAVAGAFAVYERGTVGAAVEFMKPRVGSMVATAIARLSGIAALVVANPVILGTVGVGSGTATAVIVVKRNAAAAAAADAVAAAQAKAAELVAEGFRNAGSSQYEYIEAAAAAAAAAAKDAANAAVVAALLVPERLQAANQMINNFEQLQAQRNALFNNHAKQKASWFVGKRITDDTFQKLEKIDEQVEAMKPGYNAAIATKQVLRDVVQNARKTIAQASPECRKKFYGMELVIAGPCLTASGLLITYKEKTDALRSALSTVLADAPSKRFHVRSTPAERAVAAAKKDLSAQVRAILDFKKKLQQEEVELGLDDRSLTRFRQVLAALPA